MTKDINEDFIKNAERDSHNCFIEGPLLHQEERLVPAPVRKTDLLDMLANNKAVPVRLMKEHVGEVSYLRLQALMLATEVALKINHFENQYKNIEALLQDIDIVHAIADRNLKYIVGEQ